MKGDDDLDFLNPASIVFRDVFTPGGDTEDAALAAAAITPGPVFEVIRTNERDPYDPPAAQVFGFAVTTAKAKAAGDAFGGTDRKVAKLSIAKAEVEEFENVQALVASLPADSKMANHQPPILRDKDFDRVKEEKRNVRVKAFLWAASREKDNDFHVIIGRGLNEEPRLFVNVEISGLPDAGAASFDALKNVRDAWKGFFKGKLQGEDYDFYKAIPVIVQGSLFFDISHAKSGDKPGPQSAKPASIWEIHPVTEIIFNP
jgi:hypothetical protein